MRRTLACVSDLYSVLNDANIQLSNKQKDAVVAAIFPHIEHSRLKAYEQGKQSVTKNKANRT